MKAIVSFLTLVLSQTLSLAQPVGTNANGGPKLLPGRGTTAAPTPAPTAPTAPPANTSDYAVFVHTNTLISGMALAVRWNNPNPFTAQNDELSLYRVEGTNLVLKATKSIFLNASETFVIPEPGVYEVAYVQVTFIPLSKTIRAVSSLVFVNPTVTSPPPPSDIAVYGDSFMQQMAGVLETRIGRRVHNFGVAGENTRQIRARLPRVLAVQPRTVVMDGGMMDAFDTFLRPAVNRIDESETLANLDVMFRELRARGIKVVFLGFAEHFIPTLRPKYAEVAARHGVIYIADAYDGVFGHPEFMAGITDIHPNTAGYHRIIDRFITLLFVPEPARLVIFDAGPSVIVSWFAASNRTYVVQFSGNLPTWFDLVEVRGQGIQTNLFTPKGRFPSGYFRLIER